MAETKMSEKFHQDWLYNSNMDEAEFQNYYKKWAKHYGNDMVVKGFNSPRFVAEKLASLVPVEDRANFRVLDLCAGTGLVGVLLSRLGFRTMHALDANEEMLDRLNETKLYSKTFQSFIGNGNSVKDISNGAYDAVVVSAGFAMHHLPADSVREIARMIKPGGFFVNAMNKSWLTVCEDYHGLEPLMDKMEHEEGIWRQLERTVTKKHIDDMDGVLHVYQRV